jgi:hypothetical protein
VKCILAQIMKDQGGASLSRSGKGGKRLRVRGAGKPSTNEENE